MSELLKKVRSKRTLERAWRVILENARTSSSNLVRGEVEDFAKASTANINSLSAQLSKGSFRFEKARGIPLPKALPNGKKDPKRFRPIVLAPLKSRIVQRAVLDALLDVPELRAYSESPYSFGGIRRSEGSLSAVPAAVQCVLDGIADGGEYVAFADIQAFFTKIPKPLVTDVVAQYVHDRAFVDFFEQAIRVELDNMATLRDKADLFPIEDIGVAQGNSLSPLLGNILLRKFDNEMNSSDVRCIRYIDDFIIIAPSAQVAKSKLKLARRLLSSFDMTLSDEKSSVEPIHISDRFEFLGIEFCNGFIRPAPKALRKLEENVREQLVKSSTSMRQSKPGDPIPREQSLVSTLRRVDGIVRGWGKHYRFCNDRRLFEQADRKVAGLVRDYLGRYRSLRAARKDTDAMTLLGIDELSRQSGEPMKWPKLAAPFPSADSSVTPPA